MVFYSNSKVVFENLSKAEKIYYVILKSARMSVISSLLVLPLFLAMNNKARVTSKHNAF